MILKTILLLVFSQPIFSSTWQTASSEQESLDCRLHLKKLYVMKLKHGKRETLIVLILGILDGHLLTGCIDNRRR